MRARLGRKLKVYINTLAKKFALRMKRSKADPQTSAHFARLLYSYLEPGSVLPNGTRLTSLQFQALLRQTERHYNAMPYGRSPSSVQRIWANPSDGSSFVLLHMTAGGIEFLSKDSVARNGAVQSIKPVKKKSQAARFSDPITADDAVSEVNARLASGLAPSVSFASPLNSNPLSRKQISRRKKLAKRLIRELVAEERHETGGRYGKKFRGYARVPGLDGEDSVFPRRRNPVPSSAPSRCLLCIGQLRDLELYDPKTGRTGHIKPKGKWLAWDGKQFQICNVRGQVNASLPSGVVAKHRKFHAANPQGKPFLASMPDRGPTVKNVGLLKSLVYYVPSKIRSPGKNKYLWHHAFGDTGHKGGDSYPIKVMPMLQRDSAGNLFIKRRPGNIFRVDNWLRG